MNRQSITRIFSLSLFILGAMYTVAHTYADAVTDIAIAWDPNTEDDLNGYGIYISEGTPGPPFEHYGDVFVDELSDPENPQITLTEIEDGTYYIAATAFDDQGNESDYSKTLEVRVSGPEVSALDTNDRGGSGVGDSGGSGGGGCFISSVEGRFGFLRLLSFLSLLSLLAAVKTAAARLNNGD